MKIIILGAGQVGSTLAANLVSEDNDITLVDNESVRLEHLQDKHDLRVMKGSASSPTNNKQCTMRFLPRNGLSTNCATICSKRGNTRHTPKQISCNKGKSCAFKEDWASGNKTDKDLPCSKT